jgi:hypothetical protein
MRPRASTAVLLDVTSLSPRSGAMTDGVGLRFQKLDPGSRSGRSGMPASQIPCNRPPGRLVRGVPGGLTGPDGGGESVHPARPVAYRQGVVQDDVAAAAAYAEEQALPCCRRRACRLRRARRGAPRSRVPRVCGVRRAGRLPAGLPVLGLRHLLQEDLDPNTARSWSSTCCSAGP